MAQALPFLAKTDPAMAVKQFKALRSLYGDIGKTITMSPSQVNANLRKGQAGLEPSDPKQTVGNSSSGAAPLKIGQVSDGHTYIGGDPNKQSSWRKL